MGGSTNRSGMRGPFVRGEVATGGRDLLERADEGQKTWASSPIPKQNYWVWRVGKNQRIWFIEPVEDSGRRMAVRKKVNISAQTLSASYVHSKSLLYAFTRSSLHLRPAKNKFDRSIVRDHSPRMRASPRMSQKKYV
jgi:hypothetical protein